MHAIVLSEGREIIVVGSHVGQPSVGLVVGAGEALEEARAVIGHAVGVGAHERRIEAAVVRGQSLVDRPDVGLVTGARVTVGSG